MAAQPFFSRTLAGFYLYEPGILIPGGQGAERLLEGYLTTLYAPDAVAHFLPPGLPGGHAGLRMFYNGFHAGFPDAQLEFDETVSEGDRIATRFHLNMTHTGDFNGIPATGKRVTFGGTTIMRFSTGKVVERWSESDFLGILKQLGVVPEAA